MHKRYLILLIDDGIVRFEKDSINGANNGHSPVETIASIDRQLKPIISQDAPRMHLAVQVEMSASVLVIRPQKLRGPRVAASPVSAPMVFVYNPTDQLHLVREPYGVFEGEIEEERRDGIEFFGDVHENFGPLVGPVVSYVICQRLLVF